MTIVDVLGAAAPVEVKLLLADGGVRHYEGSPGRISFGALQLRGWQIFEIDSKPGHYTGSDTYLIKIHYDLVLDPGAPSPRWFEVGFALAAAEGAGAITVLDAIPARVTTVQEPKSYDLDQYLAFVHGHSVRLPATDPDVHLFGLGSHTLRWRHTGADGSGVHPGSYTGWATITVPAGCSRLNVDATARFDFAAGSELARECAPEPESALVALRFDSPARHRGPLVDTAPPVRDSPASHAADAPRIFVSYAHDDAAHRDAVLRLSTFLVTDCGFDVHMDRWDLDRRRDWSLWAIEQITAADFVIVVASPECKRVGDGTIDSLERRGMQSELSVLRDLLQGDRATWLPKLLPVVLPGRAVAEIPLFLQPNAADHYIVTSFDRAGADDLIRVITADPPLRRPA